QKEAISLLQADPDKSPYPARLKLYQSNRPYWNHDLLAEHAKALLDAGQFAEAELVARECLTQREMEIPDDWRTFNVRSVLGAALLGQKRFADAEPFLLTGYEGLKQRREKIPRDSPRLKEALQRLVQFCEATSQPDQAAEWKQKLQELDRAG